MGTHEAVVLEDVPTSVWRGFQEGRLRARAHAAHVARWSRSRRLGASAKGDAVDDSLVRGEAFRLRAEHLDMLESLGAAVLAKTAREVSDHDFVLLLADAEGLVVRTDGGGGFSDHAQRVRLIEGASWSEAARGTNAIGTAAAEARPTVVLGRAHFAESYHHLACYAAPVVDVHGRVVAVLDATSRVERATGDVGRAVFGAASLLGELLRLEAYASAGGSVLRAIARALDRSREPALLAEAPGRVTRMNAAARIALGGARAHGSTRELLGLGWETLLDEAYAPTPGGRKVERRIGRLTVALRLHAEPIVGPTGAPIAVMVHFEPDVAHGRAAPSAGGEAAVDAFAPIFAEDGAVRDAIAWARLVASSELPVMILAETGSGKELFARAMHDASPRAEGPFLPVNCGAIAPSLLESELFGYAPGAFTGAERGGRTGLFDAASGGTLFLDEVAEMSLAMQAALLRVLESGSFHRVGDARPERCDVRVICATCRDLEQAVADGNFRKDLYYRLKGATLRLPALRHRSDVLSLARVLLAARAERAGWMVTPGLAPEAEEAIARHGWPGNVRELISALDVALVTARGLGSHVIERSDLRVDPGGQSACGESAGGSLGRAEGDALRLAIDRHHGNVSAAARELGVARSTLYRLARKHGLSIGPKPS